MNLCSPIGLVEPEESLRIPLAYLLQGRLCNHVCSRCNIYLTNHRWRLFRRPKPYNVILYSKAAIALHNSLHTTESGVYCPSGFIDGEDGSGNIIEGEWRRDEACISMQRASRTGSNR